MRRFLLRAVAVLSAVVLLAGCGCGGERRVVVVSTNDIHSSIEGFPRLATLVEGLRASEAARGGEVLLVDAGDRWTGNPFVDLATRPLSPVIGLMNELGYDVATLGNHEFDWGQTLLRERLAEFSARVVCANLSVDRAAGAEMEPVAPYVFVEAGGLRLAFLGLVTNFSRWGRPEGKAEHFAGLTFPDVWATAGHYAALADSCDVFVGLVHLGHENELELARRVPGLDLIIGGDSHTVVAEPVVEGQTVVTQAGSKLQYAGVTTITRERRGLFGGRRGHSGGGEKPRIENHLVLLDTVAPDPRYEQLVRGYLDNPDLLAPIGRAAAPLNEHGVENLVADAVREATRAQVALYHAGGIRIDTLAGDISRADLFRIEPFLSEIYTLSMTPGQIKGLIMNKFNDTNPKESHAPDLIPSGLSYTIATDEAGEATGIIFDRPERARYLVAMPDYVYKNYIFDRTDEARQTAIQVTDAIRTSIENATPFTPDNRARIVIK